MVEVIAYEIDTFVLQSNQKLKWLQVTKHTYLKKEYTKIYLNTNLDLFLDQQNRICISLHHAAKQTAQIKWYHHKIYWPVIASKAKVHEHFLVCSIFHSARGTVEARITNAQ